MEHLDSPPLVHRRRRAGRPSKSEGPRVNYAELDQILVFGEVREGASGGVSYPSYRELAVRYGVAVSVIGEYARKNKCQARRKKAAARVRARIAEKRIELRAEAAVLGRDEAAPPVVDVLRGARQSIMEDTAASGLVAAR